MGTVGTVGAVGAVGAVETVRKVEVEVKVELDGFPPPPPGPDVQSHPGVIFVPCVFLWREWAGRDGPGGSEWAGRAGRDGDDKKTRRPTPEIDPSSWSVKLPSCSMRSLSWSSGSVGSSFGLNASGPAVKRWADTTT